MHLTVTCSCGSKYNVREDNRGKTFRCQKCDATVTVPLAEPASIDEWDDFTNAEFTSFEDQTPDDEFGEFQDLSSPQTKPKKKPEPEENAEEDEAPRRKKKKSGGKALIDPGEGYSAGQMAIFAVIGLVCVIGVGLGLGFLVTTVGGKTNVAVKSDPGENRSQDDLDDSDDMDDLMD